MTLRQPCKSRKSVSLALTLALGLGILATSVFVGADCSATCCSGSGAAADSYHALRITGTASGCCCSAAADCPCGYAGAPRKRLSPPALLRAHQNDHRDLNTDRIDITAVSASNAVTTATPAAGLSASILKVPIYLTTLAFLC
jgi:hypothetical protein